MNFLFEIIRYVTMAYNYSTSFFRSMLGWRKVHKVRHYFLSDDHDWDIGYVRVPEDAVYVQEWTNSEGQKKCHVRYEGEDIVTLPSPWEQEAKCPWLWIGDKHTEIELTRTFSKYLVVGNRIELALVLKLMRITDETELIYIDSKTFEEKKFPGEGILIDGSVSDS